MTCPTVRRAGLTLVFVLVATLVSACELFGPTNLDAVEAGYSWGGPYNGPAVTAGGGASAGASF